MMYPLMFLMAGVIAGVVDLDKIATLAVQLSWVLGGMVLVVIHAVAGQNGRQALGGAH
jgi:hypothetical protein